MNATGNHTMGSTIPRSTNVRSSGPQARQLSANSAAVPGTDGLDVSAWQPNSGINWAQVYGAGARFVYIKATENTTYTSSQFTAQWNGASAAGLVRGAYHFAVPSASSGATQANYFASHGGGWKGDGRTLPPLLDIEYNPYGATCYGLSRAAMVQWITDFSNTVKTRTGVRPAIYSTTDWWTQCTGNSGAFAANPLFIARYPNSLSSGAGTLPNGWTRYSMWQYASSGVFPGDQDVYNGSLANLQAFARAGGGTGQTASTQASLTSGKTLGTGQALVSPNGQYTAVVQPDGNFVLYGNGRALWATSSSRWAGAKLTLATNGDLQVRSADGGTLIWHVASQNTGADNLIVTNDGDLQLRKGSSVIWHTARKGADSAVPVTTLSSGQYLLSADGRSKAVVQPDGNFVGYRGTTVLWATGTSRYPGMRAVFQADGNLVFTASNGTVIKSTSSSSRGVTTMTMRNDGNLVLSAGSTTIWMTHIVG